MLVKNKFYKIFVFFFFIESTIRVSDFIATAPKDPKVKLSSELNGFLDFIRLGKDLSEPLPNDLLETISGFVSKFIDEKITVSIRGCFGKKVDESMLIYSLELLRKKYKGDPSDFDSVLKGECAHLKKFYKAEERGDRAFFINEEKEYLSRGGNPQDSGLEKVKKFYPALSFVLSFYDYCNDACNSLLDEQIITSRADAVSLFKYLDSRVIEGRPLIQEFCALSLCKHGFLLSLILNNFPKRTDLYMQKAKLERAAFLKMQQTEKEESLGFLSLQKEGLSLEKKFKTWQQRQERKLEKDLLRGSFFSWMNGTKARLENRKELEKDSLRGNFSFWMNRAKDRLEERKRLKGELFEQNVIIPNKKHFEYVEGLNRQKIADESDCCLPKDLKLEKSVAISESVLLEDFQRKSNNRLARIKRRQDRRSLQEAIYANKKNQQSVTLKKIVQQSNQELLKTGFKRWQKFRSSSHEDSSDISASTYKLESARSSGLYKNAETLPDQKGNSWKHNPYSLPFASSSESNAWRHNPYYSSWQK